MKKYLVIVALLAGCASTAPMQTYRAPGQVDAWHIAGRLDEIGEKLTITVNGQDAISGKLSMWDGSGTVSGEYAGKPMTATCRAERRGRLCHVVVGSEVAATLVF